MPIRNLDKIFAPKSVAVIGASDRPSSVGNTVLSNLIDGKFAGSVYPVNPKYQNLDGMTCYHSVAELPNVVDLAVVSTSAKTVPDIVQQCGDAGICGLVILSAGFREASKVGEALEQSIQRIAKQYNGMRIVGPDCLGVISPHHSLNASFAGDSPAAGHVAFISQSGALCTAVLDWAMTEQIGFSHFVSVGNMMDVGLADLIDYFASDGITKSIVMYVESINEARQFVSAARAFTRTKPIIAYKAGRFAESAQAAASHTGALAGVDSVYEAAFARSGIVRVFEVDDLFDCAELLARQRTPLGSRLAIITNAGGPGVMATDALLDRNGTLAQLSDDTIAKLDDHLPTAWSRSNPVDVLGDAQPERFASAVETVMDDDGVDGGLVVLSPQAMTNPTAAAQAVIEAAKQTRKPFLAVWMGGKTVQEGVQILNEAGVPTYSTPEKGVRAFMHLVAYARNRETLYETPREMPMEFSLDRTHLRSLFDTTMNEGHDILSETTSKAMLDAYGIPANKTFVARTKEDAIQYADRVGYPVAMKIYSPDITHKTDVGGVELDLINAGAVGQAFDEVMKRVKQHRTDARLDGVTIQRMQVIPGGHELIVGAKRDRVFGTVMLVGIGGTNAEIFQDRALELPPLNENLARRMLESLRSWPLLDGYRGRPAVNIDHLIEVLMRLSYLVADYPEIAELDVNPLLVSPEGAIALDARIVLDHESVLHPVRPYSHLAIRPYPTELIKRAKLKDGTPVVLRPIGPEDEPMWHELLASCSADSLRLRFRYMFKSTTHQMAARFCFIDYDREIAIVAEAEEKAERRLLGVGRLVADADHQQAEYAILVGDPWQGIGLGSLLTDYCMDICDHWGLRSVVAEMAPENKRMIKMFRHRGFEFSHPVSGDVVMVQKQLATAESPRSGRGTESRISAQ